MESTAQSIDTFRRLCEQYVDFRDLILITIGRAKRLRDENSMKDALSLEELMLNYTIQYLNFSHDTPYKEAFARNLLEGIYLKISGQSIDLQSHVYGNTVQVYFAHETEINDLVYHADWNNFWEELSAFTS